LYIFTLEKEKPSQIHNLIPSLDACPVMMADIEMKLKAIQENLAAIEFKQKNSIFCTSYLAKTGHVSDNLYCIPVFRFCQVSPL
jgi:hypothetical protein